MTTTRSATQAREPKSDRATYGLIGKLNHEWDRLCTDPAADAERAAWQAEEPALAGLDRLSDLCTVVRTDPDQTLLPLLRRAAESSQLAARAILQAMIPKIVLMVASQPRTDHTNDELMGIAVAAMWSKIKCYPLEARPAGVPAQLSLDTLKEMVREVAMVGAERRMIYRTHTDAACESAASEKTTASEQLLQVIVHATERGIIRREDAQVLATVYCLSDSRSGHDAATQLGLSRTALRQRCSRISRTLRTHADELSLALTNGLPEQLAA